MARGLADAFGIAPERARSDVAACLAAWQREGLLGSAEDEIAEEQLHVPPVKPLPPGGYARALYRIGAVAVRLRYAVAEHQRQLHPLLAHLAVPEAGDAALELDSDGLFAAVSSQDQAAWHVLHRIVTAAVEASSPALVVHGAAVAHGDRCIVMPGAGGVGKSTLAAALALSGSTVLADDVLLIERASFRAVPIPLCFNLKHGSLPILAPWGLPEKPQASWSGFKGQVSYYKPPGFDPRTLDQRFDVAAFVFSRYRAGTALQVKALEANEALQAYVLANSTVCSIEDDQHMLRLMRWWPARPAFEVNYGDLAQAVEFVAELAAFSRRRLLDYWSSL